jgi:glycosyltransferase involved in cell wall biosynthesis
LINQKIKILHTESSEGWGGQEIRTLVEASALDASGEFECVVMVSRESQMRDRGISYPVKLLPRKIGRKTLYGILEVHRVLRQEAPDIVCSHSSTDSWLVVLAVKIFGHRVKLVRYRHVSAPVSGGLLTRWLYQSSERIVTTSEEIRQRLIDSVEVIPDRIISIPTGVECITQWAPVTSSERRDAREILKLDSDTFVSIMVSTLRSWKGHVYAIRALKFIDNAHLLIVGDGPQFQRLKQLVEDIELKDRVHFLGYREDPRPFMAAADVFLQPSYSNEGVSQSLLQAMSMELPVIVSNIGGLNEVIDNEVDGKLISPKSVESFSVALIDLMEDFDKRKRLGIAARTKVEANHSVDRMVSQMRVLFKDLSI